MADWTRRNFIKLSLGGAVAAASSGLAVPSWAQSSSNYKPVFKPEDGAKLQLLRWTGFVKGDEVVWKKNTEHFTKLTGVPVEVQYLSWTDVQPKSALAAQLGSGPDIIMGWYDDPFIYPDKLVDVSDVAENLGKAHGGWYKLARQYGYSDEEKRWIAVPVGSLTRAVVYRNSWVQDAGFDKIPKDFDGFLKLSQALKKNGHPTGLALGHAVGDANGWTHWILWGFGGRQVDEDNKVAIDSKETHEALKYAKALHKTMVPGVASWLDANNNRAFLSGQISLTVNGISIWYVAKNQFPDIFKDVYNGPMPVGPSGQYSDFPQMTQAFIFKYSNYPNAAKEYLRFMFSKAQAEPWVTAMKGYVGMGLKAYSDFPIWSSDPQIKPYHDDFVAGGHYAGWAGSPGRKAASALNDFIIVDMFTDACVNGASPKAAAQRAHKRLKAIYG